ncbi:MAG: hypothetical protein FJ296_09115 [Planctomycetes bacterium]|nr:hypothetical protein [Planctomycetota bacterium]
MSWSILLPLALLAPAATGPLKDPVPVPPHVVSWDGLLEAGYDPAWRLGEALGSASGDGGRLRVDLGAVIERLARLETGTGAGRVTFGDVLAEFAAVRHDVRASAKWLAEARTRHAWCFGDAGLDLAERLRTWRVYGADWDPGWDAPDDGLAHATALSIAPARNEPWYDMKGAPRIQQVATAVFAAPDDLLAVAHDFPGCHQHVANDDRSIRLRPGSHWRGLDDAGLPFTEVLLEVSCDLPFPFGGYDMRLWVLDQLQPDGDVVTSIHSRSPDFRWMAGQDPIVPVLDGRGQGGATLVVRQQGFDLAGVPEDDDDRRAALRAGLGNLKRRAEARAAAGGAPTAPGLPLSLRLPDFDVLARG